jgi:hypothetical protein
VQAKDSANPRFSRQPSRTDAESLDTSKHRRATIRDTRFSQIPDSRAKPSGALSHELRKAREKRRNTSRVVIELGAERFAQKLLFRPYANAIANEKNKNGSH